ncbi:hypothetical protein ABBQ38_011936 [Trebouxia sp. C0009 RCD-2024]
MELRLLDIEGIHGVTLARDKLDLSAAFLIPYLLQLALSANFKVVLVLVQESSSHYQQALRKLGVNLADCISTSQVSTVSIAASLCAEGGLESVIQKVTQLCQETSAPQRKGVCVFVDSLTALYGLTSSPQEWQAFLHYCQALACVTKGHYLCVLVAHEDVKDDAHWIRRLRHAAQTEIEVRALESGASQDVAGQVLLTTRKASGTMSREVSASNPLQEPQKMFFKLGAGDIRFFQ